MSNAQFAKEAEQWHEDYKYYLGVEESIPGLVEAGLRVKARIAEVGYAAMRAEMDADKERRLNESVKTEAAERVMKLLQKSGIGKRFYERTFKTFKVDPENRKAWQACYDIASGKRTRGVILKGEKGIGKTHLAAAVINWLANEGRRVSFGNIVDVIKRVQNSFDGGTENVVKQILDCEVLVLDDLGAEYVSDKGAGWLKNLLYEILNKAYEDDKTVIITTNIDNLSMTDRYGDRITSRLSEMCEWIEYGGADRRFEKCEEKTPFDRPE
jgi:DNA replication protein DnaC